MKKADKKAKSFSKKCEKSQCFFYIYAKFIFHTKMSDFSVLENY